MKQSIRTSIIKLDQTKCTALISRYTGGWYRGQRQCSRKGSIQREGTLYCKQHDPERVKQRDSKQEKKYASETAKRILGWSAIELFNALNELIRYIETGDSRVIQSTQRGRKLLKSLSKFRKAITP